MSDPKNPEAMNEELNLEQLEGVAGGSRKDHAVKLGDEGFQCHGQDCVEVSGLRSNVSTDGSGFDSNNGIDR